MALFKFGLRTKPFADPSAWADGETLLGPALTIIALPVNGTPFDPPRAIIGDKAGTATVTDAAGNVLTGFPIAGGGIMQILALTAINSLSTTTAVWGLY